MRRRVLPCFYGMMLVMFFSVFLVGGKEVHAAGSKYTYEISGGMIRKINLQTGAIKATKIRSTKSQAKCAMSGASYSSCSKAVQEKNGYLYYTIDAFDGTTYCWDYICRVNAKTGKGFQVLAKGRCPQIVGNRIYYTKSHFNPNNRNEEDYAEGIYSMKLNGNNKKKILKNRYLELICASLGYLYVADYSDGKLKCYTLQGKKGKVIAKRGQYYSLVNRQLVYGWDYSMCGKSYHYYVSVNLTTGKAKTQSIPYRFVGANDEYMFFAGDYPSDTLYYRKMGSKKYKKFAKKVYSPRFRYGGKNNYLLFQVDVKDYDLSYNVIINLKKNKLKKVSKYYVS